MAMGERLVDAKIWIMSMFHVTVMRVIGLAYAVHFVVTTWFRFLWWPRFRFFVPARRPAEPPILRRAAFGVHRYAEINGVTLHYVEAGQPDKPVLLFLHGIFDFWFSWRHQIEAFSKDYRVICLDMRGCGESEKPPHRIQYKLELVVEDVRRFVNYLGVEKISLIAHDWGSVVGWQFVARNNDLVDRYVLMSSPSLDVIRYELTNNWIMFRKYWFLFFYQIPVLAELSVMLNDYDHLDMTVGSGGANQEEMHAYKYTFSRRGALRSSLNHYRASAAFYEDGIPITQGDARGMYLIAANDDLISSASGVYMRKLAPTISVSVMPGVGHYLHQQRPAQVNAWILDFLKAE